MRNDVNIVEKNIDDGLRIMDSVNTLSMKTNIQGLSEDDLQRELDTLFLEGKLSHSGELDWIAGRIVYSLGNEIYSEYARLEKLYQEYWKAVVPSFDYKEERKVYSEVLQSAAKIHTMLQEKLLSVR